MGRSVWPEATAVMVTAGCVAIAIRGFPAAEDAAIQQVWAAWVQAIGSIAAIAAAFLVVYLQRQGDRKAKAEQAANQLIALAQIIDSCQSRLDQVGRAIDAADLFLLKTRRYEAKLNVPLKALSGVPMHELPFAFASGHVIPALYHLEMCIECIRDLDGLDHDEMQNQSSAIEALRVEERKARVCCQNASRQIKGRVDELKRLF